MKTIHQYEASDIHLGLDGEGDRVHSFLLGIITLVILTAPGLKAKDGEDPMDPPKRMIAQILNMANEMGITIAVGEAVPAVFRESK